MVTLINIGNKILLPKANTTDLGHHTGQGHSQTISLGCAREERFLILLLFFSNFSSLSSSVWASGSAALPSGKALAVPLTLAENE